MVSPRQTGGRSPTCARCAECGMIPSFTSAAVLTQKGGLNPESTGFENQLSAYRLHNLAVRAFDPDRGHVHLHDRLPVGAKGR